MFGMNEYLNLTFESE